MRRLFVTLPLAAPVTVNGVRTEALRFRPAKAHDVRKLARKGDAPADGQAIVARLTGEPAAVIASLGDADAARAIGVAKAQFARVL